MQRSYLNVFQDYARPLHDMSHTHPIISSGLIANVKSQGSLTDEYCFWINGKDDSPKKTEEIMPRHVLRVLDQEEG